MSIINNSHAIGVDSRNLVLKTRGTLHVKVGDRYYEIDFRNLGAKEDEEKEEYILSIDSKDQIESLEYPGENKLVIGLDGSIFITKNKTFVDVTPKAPVIDIENSTNNNEVIANQITSLETASVAGRLYNDNGYSFDFENGEIITESLTVNSEVKLPLDMVKNNCCRTHSETLDDGTTKVVKKYQDYDFVEIVEKPEAMSLKSGVMIKSSIDVTLPVNIGEVYLNDCSFISGELYIVYVHDGEIIKTKLN